MTGASCPICRARPRGSTAARSPGRSTAASAHFEAWRDEVLAEEERDQHKLDRKIVNEEHWLRYGVSGRRKRNVKRLGNLLGAARAAPRLSRRAGNANLAAAEADKSGKLIIEAKNIGRTYGDRQDRRRFLDPGAARRPHRHRRAERRRQDHADRDADRRQAAGQRHHPARRQYRDGDARPAPRKPRSEIDAGRRPDRRRQRHRDGRRQAEARGQLHEGLSVRRSRCARRWKCCPAASAAG
jgi:hypothetical protein